MAAALVAAAIGATPAAAQQTPAAAPAGVVATTNNPNLAVASVKLESGVRASKVIGTAVYNDANEKIGSVDDLIMAEGDKVTVAIVSIGGVMGVGSKLVALPYTQLRREPDKVILVGVTKESLQSMPSFVY